MDTARSWTIRELAGEFGTTLRTIRFYEGLGLLTPARHGQSRIFSDRDRVRLQLILRGKRLGFTLEETAAVLDMYDSPRGEEGQLEFLLTEISQRRAAFQRKRDDLDAALTELDDLEARCRHDLSALRTGSAAATG